MKRLVNPVILIVLSSMVAAAQDSGAMPAQAERGKELFLKSAKGVPCGTCHTLGGAGTAVGPDLKKLASLAMPRGLVMAMQMTITEYVQEVKLNGSLGDGLIDYVAGAYYYNERNRTDFADVFSIFNANVPGGIGLLLADRTLRNQTTAYAGYAQVDVNLGRLTLTAGIRYTDEKKVFDIRDNRPACNAGGALPA